MKSVAAFVTAAFAASAFAQAPASPPPSWQQGKPAAMSESTLHPFAPHMTGRPAKDLPVNTLKVPAGFKVEVWADGVPEARSLALGDKGTVFVSNRNAKSVYAVVSKGGKREVKTLSRASTRRTASPSARARSTSPSAAASRATTASRASSTARARARWWSTTSIPAARPATSGSTS